MHGFLTYGNRSNRPNLRPIGPMQNDVRPGHGPTPDGVSLLTVLAVDGLRLCPRRLSRGATQN